MTNILPLSSAEAQPKRILVVEDNGLERFVIAQWLRHQKYKVVEAASADEALVILHSQVDLDAVVTDIEMPGRVNGFDIVRYIQKTAPYLNVVAVSCSDLERGQQKEIQNNKNFLFIRKPYDPEVMSFHIARLLKEVD